MDSKKHYLKVFLGLLILIAIPLFIHQLSSGLEVTGLREPVVWGTYIVNFTFCFGLGAGLLMVLISGSLLKKISDKFALTLSGVAFISFCLAGIFINLDLGRIDRFYYLIIYAKLNSPLVLDFLIMNVLIAVSAVFGLTSLRRLLLKTGLKAGAWPVIKLIYNVITIKKDFQLKEGLVKAFKVFALILVAACYVLSTEVFVGNEARPEWHTPVLSIIFFISALLAGMSVKVLIESYSGYSSGDNSKKAGMGFISFLLILDIIVVTVKYIIDLDNVLIDKVYTLFPLSCIVFLIIGNIVPLLMMGLYRNRDKLLYRLVPTFILAGILLKRADVIIPAYFRRWLPFATEATYFPTVVELLITLGVYSASILVIQLLVKRCAAIED